MADQDQKLSTTMKISKPEGSGNHLPVLLTSDGMHMLRKSQRSTRIRTGLVIALGGLQSFHSSAIELCVGKVDEVVVAIIATPDEFQEGSDVRPASHQELSQLAALGVKRIYMPSAKDVYPPNFRTRITFQGLSAAQGSPAFVKGIGVALHHLLYTVDPEVVTFPKEDQNLSELMSALAREYSMTLSVYVA